MTTLCIRVTNHEASFSCGSGCGHTPHDGTFDGIVAAIEKIKKGVEYYDVFTIDIEDVKPKEPTKVIVADLGDIERRVLAAFNNCRKCGRQMSHIHGQGYVCEYCAGIED